MTVTKTKSCFKGCGRQAKPRRLLGQNPNWYTVDREDAERTVHICGKCFKPAAVVPLYPLEKDES